MGPKSEAKATKHEDIIEAIFDPRIIAALASA